MTPRLFKRFFSFTLLMGLLFTAGFCPADPPLLPDFPPLVFHPPKPQRFVLPNGLVLFLLEDHELPLIKLEMKVRAGTQYDPPDLVGLASVAGPVMTQGGSEKHTPEEILRALDVAGASLNFSFGLESGDGALESRAEDFDKIFALFTDLVQHPLFRKDYLDLEKSKQLEDLRRMNDNPEEISHREFRFAIYGKDHPYARIPSPTTLDNIKRKDLQALHDHYFKPNAMFLAVSGDFKSAEMKQKIEAALGSWPRGAVVYPPIPPVPPTSASSLLYVQRSINQSQIRIGHTGFARHNPDHFAWEVFNELWGNGGTSRLFQTVRTQQGLAYEVGSTFSEYADRGIIAAICQTRGPQTVAAIQSILAISKSLVDAPFTTEEIHFAKESIRNRFIDNFTSSAQIAAEIMSLEYDGDPPDYLDTYTDHIAAVQPADLKRVAQTYLLPEKNVILVVGDLSTFDQPLSRMGRPVEIRIPDYSEENPANAVSPGYR